MITKEERIAEIKERIVDEFRKHRDLDWPEIAASKIYAAISVKEENKNGGWVSVAERLPEENQVVDIWEMPKTQHQNNARGLEKSGLFGKHEYTGWRSTNYRFNKNVEENCNCFLKLKERTLTPETYPNYKELAVENGEATHWRPHPPSPKAEKG